jgi:hypothetical protein
LIENLIHLWLNGKLIGFDGELIGGVDGNRSSDEIRRNEAREREERIREGNEEILEKSRNWLET